eukprot:TRINITY_DN38174_c0_g1_i1.p1 TRINITY_DN38174_c0_g1~~TRINITY_DN38174_c0_g1_i1.p1  ORF type:complete len:366 (-),score=42.54 TRINITY_DN38174_c0_g1_i1:235-1332(-)
MSAQTMGPQLQEVAAASWFFQAEAEVVAALIVSGGGGLFTVMLVARLAFTVAVALCDVVNLMLCHVTNRDPMVIGSHRWLAACCYLWSLVLAIFVLIVEQMCAWRQQPVFLSFVQADVWCLLYRRCMRCALGAERFSDLLSSRIHWEYEDRKRQSSEVWGLVGDAGMLMLYVKSRQDQFAVLDRLRFCAYVVAFLSPKLWVAGRWWLNAGQPSRSLMSCLSFSFPGMRTRIEGGEDDLCAICLENLSAPIPPPEPMPKSRNWAFSALRCRHAGGTYSLSAARADGSFKAVVERRVATLRCCHSFHAACVSEVASTSDLRSPLRCPTCRRRWNIEPEVPEAWEAALHYIGVSLILVGYSTCRQGLA